MSFPPATSAMLHNLSTLGISLRSMTDCWSRSLPCKNGTPERPQMLRRIEMIDLPAKRRLLHKYCAAASFFSSDESAKAQPAAQQEEEQHFTQHRQP